MDICVSHLIFFSEYEWAEMKANRFIKVIFSQQPLTASDLLNALWQEKPAPVFQVCLIVRERRW